MNKIDINSNVKIYFLISWILGAIILFSKVTQMAAELAYILIFISFLNVFFNALVIIFLLVMFFTFKENRWQFLHSIVLLLMNFPFVMLYCLILLLITNIL